MSNDILKKGADYLLKGGTLLSQPCQICNGLLIKFKGNIMCLNCQKTGAPDQRLEKVSDKTSEDKKIEKIQQSLGNGHINKTNEYPEREIYEDLPSQIEKVIVKKINENIESIKIESDPVRQKDNLKVLFLYLKIMKKIKRAARLKNIL
jgi:UPF0148 protein